MLNINPDILAEVIQTARERAAQYPRWIAAIDRAAEELLGNPFIEAQDDHTLVIGSASGSSYVANGTCQCEAYKFNQPCWHRSAARLYKLYLDAAPKCASCGCLSTGLCPACVKRGARVEPAYRIVTDDARRIRKIAAERATALMNEMFQP